MAVTMTLSATSSTITATVSGLDTSYAYDRRFVWYLDAKKRTEETVAPGSATHEYVFDGVYFASEHHVKLEIYSTVSGNLLTTQEGNVSTLYASIPLWGWNKSNGDASAEQTSAAYTSATNKGIVSDYSHLVWNDFVTLLRTAVTQAGVTWFGSNYNSMLLDAGDPLTAQIFNTVVQNIRYPYWTWESLPGATGYLNRLAMQRGDTVYGAYLVELAKRLNTVIGIYNGTANTRETKYTESMNLRLDDAYAISRHSAPASYIATLADLSHTARAVSLHSKPAEINQSMLLSHVMSLIAKGKADMEHFGNIALTNRVRVAVNGNISPIMVDTCLSELTSRMVVDSSPTLHLPGSSVESTFTISAVLRGLISGHMSTDTAINAQIIADLHRYASQHFSVDTAIAARTRAELTRYMAGILASALSISETTQASMTRAQARNASSYATIRIANSGSLRAVRTANTSGSTEIINRVSGKADTARPHSATGEVGLTVIQTGNVRKTLPKSVVGQSAFTIGATARAKSSKPLSVFADVDVSHAVYGTVAQSRPKLLTGHAVSGATSSGTAVIRPTSHMRGQSGNVLSFAAALDKRKTLPLHGNVSITESVTATLTFQDAPVVDWEYPVQIGDKLKITQVYEISTMGGVLELDVKLWDYPTADGDKLLIIQAFNPVPMDGVLEFDGDTFAVPYAYSVTVAGDKLEVE